MGIIYVQVGSDIEDEIKAVFAVIDIELLLFDGVDFLHSKGLNLIDEAIIVWIYFFLYCFRLEDICVEFRFLFDYLLRLFDFDMLFLLLYNEFIFNSVQRAGLLFFFVKLIVGEYLQRLILNNF